MRGRREKERHEAILQYLADCYDAYKKPTHCQFYDSWASYRKEMDREPGGVWLDRCISDTKNRMKLIVKIITNGLIGKDEIDKDNAQKACKMLQELYPQEPGIKKYLNQELRQYPTAIKHIARGGELERILIAIRVIEQETKVTPPLEDHADLIRKRPIKTPNCQ